jgi:hypothetical protein
VVENLGISLKEELLRLLRDDVEFRLAVGGLLGYSEITGRLSKTEEVVQEILKEIRLSRNDFNRLAEEQRKLAEEIVRLRNDYKRLGDRFEVILGRMGRRWGVDLGRTLLGTFKEVLEREGIEPGRVDSFSYVDFDGSITGLKGRRVQADIIVRDGRITLIEVKSFPEVEHVDHL